MKAIIALVLTLVVLGISCTKPYEIEYVNWVSVEYYETPDSLVKQFYTTSEDFYDDERGYTDTIHAWKLWVKTYDTAHTIRYLADSTNSYEILRDWTYFNYQLR